MDITDKGKEVVVFVAEDRFIAVFEKIPNALMAAIIILGVPC